MRIIEIKHKMAVLHTRQTAAHTDICWKSHHIIAGNIKKEDTNFFDSTTEIKRRVC